MAKMEGLLKTVMETRSQDSKEQADDYTSHYSSLGEGRLPEKAAMPTPS